MAGVLWTDDTVGGRAAALGAKIERFDLADVAGGEDAVGVLDGPVEADGAA
jgi:hypothetical protein